jgi:ketosteroid isomerase-like protein
MKAVLIAAALMLVASMAHAADIRSQIDAANRAWVAAYGRGDAAALAALYTQDATVLPPGSAMVHGRTDIQAFWQNAMNSGLKISALKAVSVEQYGNVAREIGTATGEANGPVDLKYVVVWKRVNGAWRLSTDIWNSNK